MPRRGSLSRLDLNLLTPLDAILTERSVSRAAQRLQLSQPSLSAALARLRTHFGDPLLVRRGNLYDLSPLARKLADQVSATLESARRIFEEQGEWDPTTATREFSVYMSDYALCTIAPIVSRIASVDAPGVRFRFLLQGSSIIDEADERLRSVDALIAPHGMIADLPHTALWRDEWVVIADAGNAAARRGLTTDDLATSPWVHTFQTPTASTPALRQLQYLGIEQHVEATVESFQAVPLFVRGTARLGLLQRGLLSSLPSLDGLLAVESPVALAPVVPALWWHPSHHGDPGHAWMRAIFARAGELHSNEIPSGGEQTAST
ncbi:LysR family transcriptional regulator [Microbacterium sp. RD1]|uniref:LysR family transcriptional regulator n=1 Tax=Microbacterium sp. RD1 TaxID=3457313 RepID=UPI003FA5C088